TLRHFDDSCCNKKLVIVFCALTVTALRFDDWKEESLRLHGGIVDAAAAAEFRPSQLKPDKIRCMVGDAHLVCFRIADTQSKGVAGGGFEGHFSVIDSA